MKLFNFFSNKIYFYKNNLWNIYIIINIWLKLLICNIYLSNVGSIDAVGMYCARGGKSGEMEEHWAIGPD